MAALSEIEKLEARFNENPDGRFFAPLADAYRKAGQPDVAIGLITKHLPKHPEYLSAHIVLGRCHLDKKDDPAASAAFQRVLELDSENIIALKSMAEITERMGQNDEARRWLMRLLTIDQMNSEAEEDLNRLGGPIAEDQAASVAEEAPAHISFADLTEPELPPEPAAAPAAAGAAAPAEPEHEPLVLDAPMEPPRASLRAMAQEKTAEFAPPAPPMLDLEPTSYDAPTEPIEGIQLEDVPPAVPTAEDFSRPSIAVPAIDFLGAEPPAATAPPPTPPEIAKTVETSAIRLADLDTQDRKQTQQRVSESEYEGFGVAPTHDADAAASPPLPSMVLDAPMEPPTVSTTVDASPSGLQLIMPEDVTPADELRRPSHKQVQIVAPDVPLPEPGGAPMVTETMAELYLQQGLKSQAVEVYRQLLAARPGDAGLQARLAALATTPKAMSAAALGTEAVSSWLRRIAKSVLPTAAAPAPPEPPPGDTPMDAAFSEPEAPAAAASVTTPAADGESPAGEPARPASTAFSLDQIFGGQPRAAAAPSEPPKHTLGASFDEFFGATPPSGEGAKPKEGEAAKPGEGDDLSAFNAWLHGLKG